MAASERVTAMSRETDEDYLKNILILQMNGGYATAQLLQDALKLKTSTVYAAMVKLVNNGFIKPYDSGKRGSGVQLEFTEEGYRIAQEILAKHERIKKWLLLLGVPEESAEEDACHMEHSISDATLSKIEKHVSMASGLLGSDSAYPEKMQMMHEAMKGKSMPMPKMPESNTDKVLKVVVDCGGVEHITEATELINRFGGAEEVEKGMELLEEIGGYKNIARIKDILAEMENYKQLPLALEFAAKYNDMADVQRKMKLVDSLGGLDVLREVTRETKKMRKHTYTAERAIAFSKIEKIIKNLE
ncbi:metal-dependent transcriptional regulator [Chakrabartyella piscis]|uniref:metal-dependent transcriptional regulator n=1 Tax=Chakrabartyella piscis TaxID=2918914 RepID=UPI0029586E09|nr:metal-dependent transcriptional regulator [Chakrabartyella piscis]